MVSRRASYSSSHVKMRRRMEKYARVIRMDTLQEILKENRSGYTGVVLGHENCPQYYRQSNVHEMIETAQKGGLKAKVNIPVIFEEFLDEFKEEAERLIKTYDDIKLYVNDWGMLAYLHQMHPDQTFGAGKGISFTYADNPWNEHIMLAEKEKYREALKAANMQNPDTIEQLRELGVDEIEMSDLELSEQAYRHMASEGFRVSVNKGMTVATMSRACHCLRFLKKIDEMGHCREYCTKETVLSIKDYFDMAEKDHKPVSPETKAIQPDMHVDGNITMVKNIQPAKHYEGVDCMVYDERIMAI